MLTILFIILILIAVCFRLLKHENTILFFSIFLLLLLSGSSFPNAVIIYLKQLTIILSYSFFGYAIILLIIIYLISELILLLGFQKFVEQKMVFLNERWQKLYVLIMSILSTNIVLDDSYIIKKYPSIFYTNSFLLSTLNPLSITYLTVVIIVSSVFMTEYGNFSLIFLVTNFFALFWFVKNIIDIIFDNDVKLDFNLKRTVLKESNNDAQVTHYNDYKNILVTLPIYTTLLLIVAFFTNVSVAFSTVIILLLLLIQLFIKAQQFAVKSRYVIEKSIYRVLYSGFVSVFKRIFLILNSVILLEVIKKIFLLDLILTSRQYVIVFIIFSILAFVITLYSKRFEFGLICIIPVLYLSASEELFVNMILFSFIISLILYVKHLMIVNLKDPTTVAEYLIGFLAACCCYITILVTSSLYITLLIFLIIVVVYVVYSFIRLKSRH